MIFFFEIFPFFIKFIIKTKICISFQVQNFNDFQHSFHLINGCQIFAYVFEIITYYGKTLNLKGTNKKILKNLSCNFDVFSKHQLAYQKDII
jgi:hypothetical protein